VSARAGEWRLPPARCPAPGSVHRARPWYDPVIHTGGGPMARFHEFQMPAITGENVDFAQFDGTLSLIVNVASQ
jgi:hypothetical protein